MPPSVRSGKLLLIIVFFIAPLVLVLGRIIYVKIDQANVRIINSNSFLPQEYVEIKVKEYFKNNYESFCFIPSYFEFRTGEINDQNNILKNIDFPNTFSTEEGEWGIILLENNKGDIIKFRSSIKYPERKFIQKISEEWDSALACSLLKITDDLVIKVKRSGDLYVVTDIYLQSGGG